jgi:hypothetical protein
VNRKSSLLEGLGVKVGIYCARRLIKHVEVLAKLLWKATLTFFCVNNQQNALYRLIYYSKSALHVSGDVFANHQEHLTIFTVSGTVHPKCCRLASWISWNWAMWVVVHLVRYLHNYITMHGFMKVILTSSCPSVCLSLWNTSACIGWTFITFYVGVLLWCCGSTLQNHKRTKNTQNNVKKGSWTEKHNTDKSEVKYNTFKYSTFTKSVDQMQIFPKSDKKKTLYIKTYVWGFPCIFLSCKANARI